MFLTSKRQDSILILNHYKVFMKNKILTFLDRLWIFFGDLIDITSRGVTYSRNKLAKKCFIVSKRKDRDNLKLYFKNIDEDLFLAIKKLMTRKSINKTPI